MMAGSKRGSRAFRLGGGENTERFRETCCREDWIVGACLDVRAGLGTGLVQLLSFASFVSARFEALGSLSSNLDGSLRLRDSGANRSCASARVPKVMSFSASGSSGSSDSSESSDPVPSSSGAPFCPLESSVASLFEAVMSLASSRSSRPEGKTPSSSSDTSCRSCIGPLEATLTAMFESIVRYLFLQFRQRRGCDGKTPAEIDSYR